MAAKQPTKAQRKYWELVRELGCCVEGVHIGPIAIHHALTGMGGRKNHDLVLPLCYNHHQGKDGIHTLNRKVWQERFGNEPDLLEQINHRLEYANEGL